jgi:hypothetical protein
MCQIFCRAPPRDRRAPVESSRSTLATLADLEAYLAALFAREAIPTCLKCKRFAVGTSAGEAAQRAVAAASGARAIVRDERALYACVDGSWQKVELAPGPQGPPGAPGPKGTAVNDASGQARNATASGTSWSPDTGYRATFCQ